MQLRLASLVGRVALSVKACQVQLLNGLQLFLGVAFSGLARGMASLVVKLRFNIPLGVLQKLINVLAEHALEILVLQALLPAFLVFVAHLLNLSLAVCFSSGTAALCAALCSTSLRASICLRVETSVAHHVLVLGLRL